MNHEVIDRIVETAREAWRIPGTAVAVVASDETYIQGYGTRELGKDDPVTPDTLFAIGSITKSVTTTAMAMLIDEGKMSWDDHPRKHVSSFKLSDPLADAYVTLRDLVSHRTGLARHDSLWYNSKWSCDELMEKIAHLPFAFSFRSAYQYNNLMFMAAGCAVAGASGMSWEEFVRSRILDPLGMERSNLSTNDLECAGNFCTPHERKEDEIITVPWCNLDAVGPCGSMNSCARELANWAKFHLGDGTWEGRQLVAKQNMDEMHTAQMAQKIDDNVRNLQGTSIESYCLGWNILDYRKHILVAHGGAIDGFNASVAMVPKSRIAVVVLSNLSNDMAVWAIRNALLDFALGLPEKDWNGELKAIQDEAKQKAKAAEAERKSKRVEGTSPSKALAEFAATYEDKAYGQAVVSEAEGKLGFEWNNHRVKLEHFHFDTFEGKYEPPDWPVPVQVMFLLGPDACVEKLRLVWPESGASWEFKRV